MRKSHKQRSNARGHVYFCKAPLHQPPASANAMIRLTCDTNNPHARTDRGLRAVSPRNADTIPSSHLPARSRSWANSLTRGRRGVAARTVAGYRRTSAGRTCNACPASGGQGRPRQSGREHVRQFQSVLVIEDRLGLTTARCRTVDRAGELETKRARNAGGLTRRIGTRQGLTPFAGPPRSVQPPKGEASSNAHFVAGAV